MNFIISAATDIGLTKKTNQDSYNVRVLTTPQGKMVFAVLCDGMGGLANGEVASASVVKAFLNWSENRLPALCEHAITDSDIRSDWVALVTEFNEKIKTYGKKIGAAVGTTITALLLTASRYYILNVGDTRAYNKENAAAYKAQKEAKKHGNMAAMPGQPVQQNTRNTNAPAMGFAIPGQTAVPQAPQSAPAKNGKKSQPNIAAPSNGSPAAQPGYAPMQPAYPPVQPGKQSAYAPVQPAFAPAQPAYAPMQQPQPMQSMNFGETTVLSAAIGETTVLSAVQPCAQNPAPQLVRLKNNERIPLNKPVFRIGKERSYVDYFVGDNPAISRSHANIIARDGAYFIVDNHSSHFGRTDG